MKKKIAILSTGGTIAMMKNHEGHAQPVLSATDFIQSIKSIINVADLQAVEWKNVPSTFLGLDDIFTISKIIKKLKEGGIGGVIITQGTDTLDETAYLLDLINQENLPIIVTGAQKNPSMYGADGIPNLIDSILVVCDKESHNKGVLVVMNGEVHPARDVIKYHAYRLDSFISPEFGPIGVLSNGKTIWYRNIIRHESYCPEKLCARVDVIKLCMGSDSQLIDYSIHNSCDGIIIEATGGGHVPIDSIPGIERAIKKGLPVVLTSRCVGRLFTNTYDFIGSEKHLKNMGVIFGDALPSHKARIKLIVLLSSGFVREDIKLNFEKEYYLQ